MKFLLALSLAIVAAMPLAVVAEPGDASMVIRAAVEKHPGSFDGQVKELAKLAWPDGPGNPEVQAQARHLLVGYGKDAIRPIRMVFGSIPARYRADVVNATIEAHSLIISGLPVEYLAVMYEAAWYGPTDARLVAIPIITKYKFTRPLLPLIDATYEDPTITPVVIDTLGIIGDARARFWLGEQLNAKDGAFQTAAASALARIGGEALAPLRVNLLSEDKGTREISARMLAKSAGAAELTALYDYLEKYSTDNATVVDAIRSRAELLERALQELDDEMSASGEPEV